MTDRGDYQYEMLRVPFSDEDAELLLSGDPPEDELLAAIAPFVEELRSQRERLVSEIDVARVAVRAAEIARPVRGPSHRAPRRSRLRSADVSNGLRPALAIIAVVFVVLVVPAFGGAALAADGASPGDALYGIDQALERIGVGAGGAAERIDEALALLEEGRVSEALLHASEAVLGDGGEGAEAASLALIDAAHAVTSTEAGEADAVRLAVAEMLHWMATNQVASEPLDGIDFGRRVAELAAGIAGPNRAVAADRSPAAPADPPAGGLDGPIEPPAQPAEPVPGGTPAGPSVTVPSGPPETVPGGPPETAPNAPGAGAPQAPAADSGSGKGNTPTTVPGGPGGPPGS